MSKLENEENSSETNEETTSSEQSETSSEDNTTSEKEKKKFDVWKEYKKLKKENRVLKATSEEETSQEEMEAEKAWTTDNSFNDVKFDIFLLKNKEAEEYWEEIKDTLNKYPNMSLDEAYSFSKANYTKSQSKTDFSTKSATTKKELKDYSKEEIVALKDSKKLLEWSRVTWQLN